MGNGLFRNKGVTFSVVIGPQIFLFLVSKFICVTNDDGYISVTSLVAAVKFDPEGFIDGIGLSFRIIQDGLHFDIPSVACLEINGDPVFRVIHIGIDQSLRLIIHDFDGTHDFHRRCQVLVEFHADRFCGVCKVRVSNAYHCVNFVFPPNPVKGHIIAHNRKSGIIGLALRHQHAVCV